jgi:hypothetical protein
MNSRTYKMSSSRSRRQLTLKQKLRLFSPSGHHLGGDFGGDILSSIIGADIGGTSEVPKGVKESQSTCSPAIKPDATGGKNKKVTPAVSDSCLPIEALERIRTAWNHKYSDESQI